MRRVYLDYSATTPIDPRVIEAMQPVLASSFGNASSIHSFGREAKARLEESRETIALALGAKYDELYFTSGGTESDNHAIAGVARAALRQGRNHLVISAVEHHAVLHAAEALRSEGFTVDVVPVDKDGMVDPSDVQRALRPETCLVSVIHVNNEVGVIEPIGEIGRIARERGVLFHTDAVQSVGKLPVDVNQLSVDLLSLTAHKIYGPKGIGALYIRRGTRIDPLLHGGGQESNRRAGTENVAAAVGFASAVSLCMESMDDEAARLESLHTFLSQRLAREFPGILINGHPKNRIPNILSVSFDASQDELDGDALIMGMDLRGVAVTSGSACASGSLEPSHVLRAMGRSDKTALATVRFSLGRLSTVEDVDYAVDALRDVVAGQREARGLAKVHG
jgi:cysteine desulfurase